ncbi:MAG: BNR-4 repeat-containing protein [Phycisphaeraceae bacterium]
MCKKKFLGMGLLTVPALSIAGPGWAQIDPLSVLDTKLITDNNAGTNEVGRDRVSINSTPFKNESLWTVGDYQFTTYYREDGKLLVARRDLTAPTNDWDIRVTQFTSFNINDAHNVPVIGVDGDGYLHLAWGTHGNPLLYTRSNTPVTSGQPLTLIGDAVGNSAAPNTMTGSNETGTTYPNFIKVPGTGDLLFNYRTGGSGNGTYRITRWNDATNTWTWADQTWIKNTDASGLTYNAYPHNLSYDSSGGLHATWTYRYNSSSPTGNSGFQTNHNLFYAYSPDDGVTWYKDMDATVPYPADIDESNSQIIVNIPEGSSLINTGTQAIDAHDRPAIATWWAPHAHDAVEDHRRQYMYVGHDGAQWFTSQITHRRSDPNSPVPESQLGVNHMGRPQIVIDDYNRAFVIYKDKDTGGGVSVAYSQADSRDDWEFIQLTTQDLGRFEPTLDRALWDDTRQLHLMVQVMDGNSNNGGSDVSILEWDSQAALGRVLKWTAQTNADWDGVTTNFSDLGTPDDFDSFDNVVFDDTAGSETVQLIGNIDAGKVTVDTASNYVFTGGGQLTSGSLAVVGGGSLELANDGNSYAGQTRVSNATLTITGDASAMTGTMVVADGGTLVMDSSDASTMASDFEVWPTGTLQIGTPTSTTNVFPDNPGSILNDGLIRVYTNETLQNITGQGSVEVAGGMTTLLNNTGMQGGVRVKAGATAIAGNAAGLGTGQFGGVVVEDGGALRIGASMSISHTVAMSGEGGFAGALQSAAGTDVTLSNSVAIAGLSTSIDTAAGSTATINSGVTGTGALAKQGTGTLHLKGDNTYTGRTIVRSGLLIIDQSTGLGETIVDPGGTLSARGTVRDDLTVLGGGTVRINAAASAPLGTLYADDFSGGNNALNGTTPDTSFDGTTWVAAPTFQADGDSVSGGAGGSATLAFSPTDGNTYTLEASFDNIIGDTDWFALGFVNGQSANNSTNARFITNDVVGLAWAMYRGSQSSSTNTTFLGDLSVGNPGVNDGSDWLAGASAAGGAVDIRIILDTTGGAGAWTATMEADTGSGFQLIRATEALNDESIDAVGIANSNTADITGRVTAFSLSVDVPAPTPAELRTLTVLGDAAFQPGATLELNLFNTTNHDVLDVQGTLTAGGTLAVALDASAPSPQLNDVFDLIDFGAVVGTFNALDLPDLGPGLAWDTASLYTTGELIVTDFVPIPGDTDGDGDIDDSDLGTAFANYTGPLPFGTGGKTAAQGDTDGDGDVDDSDLGTAFAGYTGPLGPTNVPEPASLTLLALGGWCLSRRRRTRSDA